MANNVDCQKCNNQIKDIRGCEKDIPPVKIEGYELTRCPLKYVTQIEWIYLEAHSYFARGILPNPGGWLDQPAKFGMIMNLIDGLMNEQDKEQAKKWQSKT